MKNISEEYANDPDQANTQVIRLIKPYVKPYVVTKEPVEEEEEEEYYTGKFLGREDPTSGIKIVSECISIHLCTDMRPSLVWGEGAHAHGCIT